MSVKTAFRILLGLLLVGMGVAHFVAAELFVRIIPPYLPAPETLNRLAGAFEILGGVGIQLPAVRRLAGFGCVALFLAVYVVNIDMVFRGASIPGVMHLPPQSPMLWLRLPLQFVFIAWALWVTGSGTRLHETATKM